MADLSLYGLIQRLELAEKYKEVTRPNEEQAAVLESEAAAKKAVGEKLQALTGSGMTSYEKKRAKEFLEAQVKAVDPDSRQAQARTTKLKELIAGVQAASAAEDPGHVRKAKTELAKAESEFEVINKDYERWEKGKNMLLVDELNSLKRSHRELSQRLEVARTYIASQLERCAEAAAPPPAALTRTSPSVAASVAAARGKGVPKAPNAVRGGGPAVRTAGATSRPGGYPTLSAGAIRQAQVAAQVRAEVEEASLAAAQEALPRPRPQPRARPAEAGPVLSYSCTCAAVAEHLGIKEDQAKAMASSSSEFSPHFTPDVWTKIQDRSLAIERAQREQKREAEKRKTAAVLAKVAEKQSAPVVQAPAKAGGRPAALAGKAPAAAPKAKPKAVPAKNPLSSMAGGNRFGGMNDDDSEDDEWTSVKR